MPMQRKVLLVHATNFDDAEFSNRFISQSAISKPCSDFMNLNGFVHPWRLILQLKMILLLSGPSVMLTNVFIDNC